jgi:hypothetical protein
MSAWSDDELRRIADADELDIAAVRSNGELRSATPIWVVRAGDELYVRAAYGSGSGCRPRRSAPPWEIDAPAKRVCATGTLRPDMPARRVAP